MSFLTMCKSKIPKDKFLVPVTVRQTYIDGLTGRWKDPNSEIWKFVRAKKLTEQAATVKKIGQSLEKGDDISPVLDVLIDTYLQCPPKHQIKRAIASCLGIVAASQPCVEDVMRTHVALCLKPPPSTTTLAHYRTVIDNFNSLLENFPLGERCLQSLLAEALSFLHECLKRFYKETELSDTPVTLSEAMHNCHVTVQVWNKLVARTECLFDEKKDGIGSEVSTVIVEYLDTAWKILIDGNFMTDCRAACGMSLPLIFKVICKDQLIIKVVKYLFPTSAAAKKLTLDATSDKIVMSHPVLADSQHPSWPTTMVCVAGGCLAMLGSEQLAAQLDPGTSLLCDVIGQQLVDLTSKMYEVSSRVVLSRTLMLWTSRAVQTLSEISSSTYACLRDSLRGDAAMPAALMEYAWTHFEDATDVIRHQARLIFDNLLKCHIVASGEESSNSKFLLGLLESLLSSGWQHRGRYGPLCCLVRHLGTAVILQQTPALPRHLLAAMSDQTLAGYSAELYEELFSTHRRELSSAAGDAGGHMTTWQVTWVDPLLETLCVGSRLQVTHVIEYILPKLLKHSPDTLPYMTAKLTEGDRVGAKLAALVTCLKRAKMLGILQRKPLQPQEPADGKLWYGVVSVDVLKKSLCHQNEQLRLDAFGLLVENLKTTEILTQVDLDLIVFFLPLNASSQSPSFRQHLAGLLKKLFLRLRDGAQCLRRKARKDNMEAEQDIARYKEFVQWFIKKQFESLYVGASFPCRTMALSALSTYTEYMLEHGTTNHKDACEFALSNYITPEQVQTLLECLSDSFELNKIESYRVLTSLPYQKLYLQNEDRLLCLLKTGLALASSTRPQDSATAAYLLRVLITQPTLHQVAAPILGRHTNATHDVSDDVTGAEAVSERRLLVLQILVEQLTRQLEVARRSLIHAAATEPLYPTLLCIRYLLNDCNLGSLSQSVGWRELVRAVIDICFKVALVVSPVVSNSSPEGNVPLGPGLELQAVVQSPEDAEALRGAADSGRTVSLIPEYLVVCCWRSIKECSLLLGQLTLTAPLTDPSRDPTSGLVSVSQLHELGDYFTTQLLESRHRGAFELAYAGFVKMTEMLWKCPLSEVQALPKQWLSEIMRDIKSRDPSNRLCATRRSAGVPFYVQAIVSAEPVTTGRACFKELMKELLELAVPTDTNLTVEDPAQVHALNVLRALFRDTRLGEDVFPYVTGGLQAAILGYSSQLWPIRNSATLLFSALMTRIFGVKRSKDEMSKKNCLTGRVFFHRFPALYQFLLDQMEAGTSNIGSSGVYQLHPGLYPVLMVLARLYPSVVEGSNTTFNTAAFVPYIIRCASSPVYKTRLMAARAIRPLVGKDQIAATLTLLLECLPATPDGATSQNKLHGVLLQLTELVESVGELPTRQATELLITFTSSLSRCFWILTDANPCLVTRKAFSEVCFSAVALEDSLHSPEEMQRQTSSIQDALLTQALEQLFASISTSAIPELSEYLQTLTRHLLIEVSSGDCATAKNYDNTTGEAQTSAQRGTLDATTDEQLNISSSDLVHIVVRILRSPAYEVRLEGLDFLSCVFPDELDMKEIDEPDTKRSRVRECNIKCLQESLCVYRQLVGMVMSEGHTECLTKVLELLCNHERIHSMPWRDATNTSYDPFMIMKRLAECKAHASDDVRCAAHELSACLIPHLYKQAAQGSAEAGSALSSWCGELEKRCMTQESVSSRLTTAASLRRNGTWLLMDPDNVMGPAIYDVWTIVARLLQDEDVDVRQVAARVVYGVTVGSPSDLTGDDERSAPQPVVALDSAASRLVSLRSERDWRGLFDCLLTWVLQDLEPDWLNQEEKEVRLFDKGEMNTYRDEMLFVNMAAKHLRQFLQNSVNHVEVTSPAGSDDITMTSQETTSETAFIKPNVKSIVNAMRLTIIKSKLNELKEEFESKVSKMADISGSTPFLMTSQYQEDMVCLRRRHLALSCLASVALDTSEAEMLLGSLSSALSGRFGAKDAQPNVLFGCGKGELGL